MDSGDVCSAGVLNGRAGEWVVIARQERGEGGRRRRLSGGRGSEMGVETGVETAGDGVRTRSQAKSKEKAGQSGQGRSAGRSSVRCARRLKKRTGCGEESFRLRQSTRQTQRPAHAA